MKYINQLDYPHWLYVTKTDMEDEVQREKGKVTTIRSSGCGLCSAIMVADQLLPNSTFDLTEAIDISYATKANHKAGTDYKRFGPAFAEKLGLRMEMANDAESLCNCLRTGGAAVINVGGDYEGHIGVFSHGGHYITAIGMDAEGRVIILDPSYKPNKFEEEGRKGKVEMKNDVIALCDPQLLVEDTATRDPGFYHFWRV